MNIEELIYDYGNVMYTIGRYETDGKDTGKEYNKLVKRKEELKKIFDEYFNSSTKKMANTLGIR
jgi:hypothetical protein